MKLFRLVLALAIAPIAAAEEELIETENAEKRDEFTLVQISERVRNHSELILAHRSKIQSTEAQGRQASAWQNPIVSAELGRLKDTFNNNMTYDLDRKSVV